MCMGRNIGISAWCFKLFHALVGRDQCHPCSAIVGRKEGCSNFMILMLSGIKAAISVKSTGFWQVQCKDSVCLFSFNYS